jgi:hypothetical protein
MDKVDLALGIAYACQERRQDGLSKPVAKELARQAGALPRASL